MMVAVARHETVPAHPVVGLHALDHMHGKWKASHPRLACVAVGEIELARRRVEHPRLGAEIVPASGEEMWLLAPHEVDVAHGMARFARQRRHPHQAGSAVAQEVKRLHLSEVVNAWKDR